MSKGSTKGSTWYLRSVLSCSRTDLSLRNANAIVLGKVLEAIGRGCAHLRELRLQVMTYPRRLRGNIYAVLEYFRGLTRLDIGFFGGGEAPETEISALVSRLAGTLRELNISDGIRIGEQGAKDIARFLGGRLERLTLHPQTGIGHAGLLAIATQCSRLSSLNISGCSVNENTLPMIMPHLTGLLELNVSRLRGEFTPSSESESDESESDESEFGGRRRRRGDSARDAAVEHMRAISMCTRLEKLDLDCNDLGDENVIHIVSSCDRLRELRLLENRLTSAVIPTLTGLRHLETLYFFGSFGPDEIGRIANTANEWGGERLSRLPRLLVLH